MGKHALPVDRPVLDSLKLGELVDLGVGYIPRCLPVRSQSLVQVVTT